MERATVNDGKLINQFLIIYTRLGDCSPPKNPSKSIMLIQ